MPAYITEKYQMKTCFFNISERYCIYSKRLRIENLNRNPNLNIFEEIDSTFIDIKSNG